MFSKLTKKDNSTPQSETQISAATVIGVGCEIYGNLSLSTPLQLDGKIEGDIVSSDCVIIGEKGWLQGNVECREIAVFGQMTGDINARHVHLQPSAVFSGNINTETLKIEQGAVYQGNLNMNPPTVEPAIEAAKEAKEKAEKEAAEKAAAAKAMAEKQIAEKKAAAVKAQQSTKQTSQPQTISPKPQANDSVINPAILAAAANPKSPPELLQQLAYHKELRPVLAENPATYEGLLQWLAGLNDPAVNAALARRKAKKK
ncbi:MAG: polymer-forming cytoskeletal protein [Neisseriaceae bacterium]|nr:polymer-forming cytoskeletal protein [Neisseriaceae bacterium]MBQ9724438.1 polymer-forming cytoskeletal protein [Neisseriaceae bacterium]MBR1818676.1 polymer-forming cytoskeletal protein [Neisseriaceae bacterium]